MYGIRDARQPQRQRARMRVREAGGAIVVGAETLQRAARVFVGD